MMELREARMLDQDKRDLLADVSQVAHDVGDSEPVERHYHESQIAMLFDRCRSMFDAVRLLLENGFVQEAAALTRPLFTDSLILGELAQVDEKRRIEILAGRSLADFADIEGIFFEMRSGGEDVDRNLAHIAERRQRIQDYTQRHGVNASHWTANEKTLSESVGRPREYLDFRMSHHFVHGSAAITEHRSSVGEDDVMGVGGPNVDLDAWELPTAMFAAHSTALACRGTCKLLNLREPDELDAVIARIDEVKAAAGSSDGE
jgi:hypothetical protein